MKTFYFKLTLLAVILLVCRPAVKGCLNSYHTLLSGELTDGVPYSFNGRFNLKDKKAINSVIQKAFANYLANPDLDNYSDYATALVYGDSLLKAKSIFIEIEQKYPGLYITSVNLGTIYELLGHNDSALIWIQRAVKINPESHNGSEWIHVQILKHKLASEKNPEHLLTASILGIDFGNAPKPQNLLKKSYEKEIEQLEYQLSERMSFVKPPDLVVGQLLFDLGNMIALEYDVNGAIECYEAAIHYGYETELIHERMEALKPLAWRSDLANMTEDNIEIIVLIMLSVITAIAMFMLVKIISWLVGRNKYKENRDSH